MCIAELTKGLRFVVNAARRSCQMNAQGPPISSRRLRRHQTGLDADLAFFRSPRAGGGCCALHNGYCGYSARRCGSAGRYGSAAGGPMHQKGDSTRWRTGWTGARQRTSPPTCRRYGGSPCSANRGCSAPGLEGKEWLGRLSKNDPGGFNWETDGKLLTEAPYAPPGKALPQEKIRSLIAAARAWVT